MLLLSRSHSDNPLHGSDPQVRCYRSTFTDEMEMLAPTPRVASYMNRHQSWFEHCAKPMQALALDHQSYALTLGRFGNFGFEVEPTISLRLLPEDKQMYRIETVRPVPQSLATRDHYDVDFQASMQLIDQTPPRP